LLCGALQDSSFLFVNGVSIVKNIPIIGKFLLILAVFGFFAIATSLYSTAQMRHIANSYTALLAGNSTATLKMARAGRNLIQVEEAAAQVQLDPTPALSDADVSLMAARESDSSRTWMMPLPPRQTTHRNLRC
jgi:methyl-accepting chemotaxis protein